MKRLKFLLEKSGAYATILGSKLAKQQEQAREKAAQLDAAAAAAASAAVTTDDVAETEKRVSETPIKTRKTRGTANTKRKATDANYQLDEYLKEDVSQ